MRPLRRHNVMQARMPIITYRTLTILRASKTKEPKLTLNAFLLFRSIEWLRPLADMTLERAAVRVLRRPSSLCSASSCSPAYQDCVTLMQTGLQSCLQPVMDVIRINFANEMFVLLVLRRLVFCNATGWHQASGVWRRMQSGSSVSLAGLLLINVSFARQGHSPVTLLRMCTKQCSRYGRRALFFQHFFLSPRFLSSNLTMTN